MTEDPRFADDSRWHASIRPEESTPAKYVLRVAGVLAIAVIYFASAKLALSLAFVAEQVSPVWPPTGIALAVILLCGYRVWPGIALGAFVANATANEPLATAVGIAIGNTLEALLGAWLLQRFVGFDNALERIKDVLGLIVLAAGLSTIVSATIGVTSLCAGGVYLPAMERTLEWTDFGPLWWVWWLGDFMGALVVAPVILTWATLRDLWTARRRMEALVMVVGLVVTSLAAFALDLTAGLGAPSLVYTVFPFVIWAALRFGQPGTTAVTFVAASLAIWATLHDLGPFSTGSIHEQLLLLQAFMGVVAITALLLGAALCERRRAEDEVRDSEQRLWSALEELKAAERRKDEFLATLAHELRSPLAPIHSGVELMRLLDLSDPKLREVRDLLDRQVRQLSRLVDDLLDVSRVTRGKIRLKFERVDLTVALARAVETSRPVLESRGHELTVSLPDESLYLQADSTRLAQVFANLLNNAAKYMAEGGQVAISVARDASEAIVRVRDTGVGIAPDVLPSVFDLFAQADRSLDRSEGGLGIGLTLVRSLVEMHSGSVQAFSDGFGKGSEFVVRLPLCSQPPVNEPTRLTKETACAPKSAARQRILVVDDNLDAAQSLGLILNAAGHEVRTAYDGASALEAARAYLPDVVLLDIGLPGMDGYEVARRIRAMPALHNRLLVAVTGHGQEHDKHRSQMAGFSAHLVKPVDLKLLRALVDRAKTERTNLI
jgi:signal transduction histidine kinase/ActR/RegA family two-component response regulator